MSNKYKYIDRFYYKIQKTDCKKINKMFNF